MSSDRYKVKILHYLNPHLIWVLVENAGGEKKVHFEQIGIYGLLPLNVTIDNEGNVITTRSEDWMPAVTLAMNNIFQGVTEVWFQPTFLDKTSSIFDDNLHKYGDLILEMDDGEQVSMTESLLRTGIITEDVPLFHRSLNTELNYVALVKVHNRIRNSLESLHLNSKSVVAVLKSQSSVYQKTVELHENAVSRSWSIGQHEKNAQLLLNKQLHGLNACKDIDEVSIGRACGRNTHRSLSRSSTVSSNGSIANDVKSFYKRLELYQKEENLYNDQDVDPVVPRFVKRINKTIPKEPEKRFITFGPPEVNRTQLGVKEIDNEEVFVPIAKEIQKDDTEVNCDNLNRSDFEEHLEADEFEMLKGMNLETKINNDENFKLQSVNNKKPLPRSIQRKMSILKEKISRLNDSSSATDTTNESSSNTPGDDSDSESISALVSKLDLTTSSIKKAEKTEPMIVYNHVENNVNPFKNLDGSKSVFVDKLTSPILMVHAKHGNRVIPTVSLRDFSFGSDIHVVLRNMNVRWPMRLQTVSWPLILRGHSLFLVSPAASGKTLGYVPAICRLVRDSKNTGESLSLVRLTCIIVCATSASVYNVDELCKMFLHEACVFACYAGMTDVDITTKLLNGCDILICTPTILVHLMRENLGLDLRNLNTFVIDDCERISKIYKNEIKLCLSKVKEMIKNRVNKEAKVQYVVMSRIWSTFMSSLAKKAPDSIICISAFQECVLYSESNTTFQFLEKKDKVKAVLQFVENIDRSKKTVIACRSDEEVQILVKALTNLKHVVYACDNTMTVQQLYAIDFALGEYQEPLKGPILVCCDGNLMHLNVTDAHYLIHFSLPELFSTFSRRFAVLIDNYSSVFNNQESGTKIKIFLDKSNVEQLPKILNFIKRCGTEIPAVLDKISSTVVLEKDLHKARAFVPLCSTLLKFGKCPDFWNCKERHSIFQDFDKPLDWMPTDGNISFRILHYHSAVHYSARLLYCTSNGVVTKYPQSYNTISMKLGMYYGKEQNQKLHGVAKPGDVCGISIKQNLFARCQIVKVLKYNANNLPILMLINLIDEEKLDVAKDTCLYHLPDNLKNIESHVVKVILSNIAPLDKDITYTKLAENQLKGITENNEDLYMRGQISLVIAKTIFVETLEACQDLAILNEPVVKNDFRSELLNGHAVDHPDHINTLLKLCDDVGIVRKDVQIQKVETHNTVIELPKVRWAHLERDEDTTVYYLNVKNPSLFFVQNVKFKSCLKLLLSDIKKYLSENVKPVETMNEGDIVIAEFPDESTYERARIDSVIDGNKAKCFFVDLGNWSDISSKKIWPISEKLITQLPFQAIECRLVGIRPVGEEWSDFSTNWFVDKFYSTDTELKYLFAKRFTTEKAFYTGGDKYGISLIDTYANDVCINKVMLDSNLAKENEEIEYLTNIDCETTQNTSSSRDGLINGLNDSVKVNNKIPELNRSESPRRYSKDYISSNERTVTVSSTLIEDTETNSDISAPNSDQFASNSSQGCEEITKNPNSGHFVSDQQKIMDLFRKNPLRSVPLVDDDDIDDDKWDTLNPVQILMGPNMDTSNITEIPKIIPSAIEFKKPEEIKSECEVIKERIKPELSSSNEDKLQSTILDRNSDQVKTNNVSTSNIINQWSVSEKNQTLLLFDATSAAQMKIVWNQDSNTVTFKVYVTVDKYQVIITDKKIKFHTKVNNIDLGFEFEFYGAVYIERCTHTNKTRYVEVNLNKIRSENWLTLYIGDINQCIFPNDRCEKLQQVAENISENNLRKPKIVWRQNKSKVTMKIMLITKKYDISIKDKYIKFYAEANDEEYGFEFELYGVVDITKCSHNNKGQYIQVNLQKVMESNWRILGKGYIKKWIIYDVDNIDVSSDDEHDSSHDIANLSKTLKINHESDTEDEFADDVHFEYKKEY